MLVCGPLAQLVERHAYTVDVIGSSPVGPTARSLSRNRLGLRLHLTPIFDGVTKLQLGTRQLHTKDR